MIVILTTNVDQQVRGILSRYLLEPKSGTYVGTLPNKTKDWLVDVCRKSSTGWCTVIWSVNNEQGFDVTTTGVDPVRKLTDLDGVVVSGTKPKTRKIDK